VALAGLAGTVLFLSGAGDTRALAAAAAPFAVAHVQFEQNATDGDVEVVFEVKGGLEGLSKLTVVAPDGRTVADFAASDASTLGLRQFRFESPEPRDVASLKAAYPAGEYVFSGVTSSGSALHSRATLSHTLPATATFVRPAPDAENVPTRNLVLAWTPVKGVAGYLVYVEQEELNVSVNAHLPGSASSFGVPAGFLAPGTEYKMGIGAQTKDGNVSYVDASFRTAPAK
jgi:hypothetical protein